MWACIFLIWLWEWHNLKYALKNQNLVRALMHCIWTWNNSQVFFQDVLFFFCHPSASLTIALGGLGLCDWLLVRWDGVKSKRPAWKAVQLELQGQVAFNWQVSRCASVYFYSCVCWEPCGAHSFLCWAGHNAHGFCTRSKSCASESPSLGLL